MNKRTNKKEKFISGIHNYCDRWCERCTFTERCAIYVKPEDESPFKSDINNKEFWKKLSQDFINTISLLRKAAEERGIDLDSDEAREEQKKQETKSERLRKSAGQHPISKLCKKYQGIAMPFVKKSIGMVDKTRELVNHLHMGIKTEEDVVYTVADIGDCFDIINWYLLFMHVKLQRALIGKSEGEEWEEENNFPKDSDGSAKIAVIGIERSMEAWSKLFELMPSIEDDALEVLSLLSQLKRKVLEEFPDAMKFMRPGFDDTVTLKK